MEGGTLAAAIALEQSFKAREELEHERGAARNALETFVYSMRAALEGKHKV